MARKKTVRTPIARIPADAGPRHLWLAGLGVAAIASREGMAAAAGVAQRIALARKQAIAAVGQAQSNMLSTVADLRNQIETGTGGVVAKLETAVQPLIAKLKPAKAKRTARRGRPVGSKNKAKTVRRTAKTTKTVRRARKA